MTAARRVELYTAPFCANCDRARELLARAGVAFAEIGPPGARSRGAAWRQWIH